jgi:hypothetical protein
MNQIVPLSSGLLELLSKSASSGMLPFTREIFLLEVIVAGTTFCPQIEELAPKLLPESVLKMLRDPNNPHDEHAIGIYLNSTRIGWIPRELNLIISRLMDAGKAFFCRVVETEWKGTWLRVKVNVYMVE